MPLCSDYQGVDVHKLVFIGLKGEILMSYYTLRIFEHRWRCRHMFEFVLSWNSELKYNLALKTLQKGRMARWEFCHLLLLIQTGRSKGTIDCIQWVDLELWFAFVSQILTCELTHSHSSSSVSTSLSRFLEESSGVKNAPNVLLNVQHIFSHYI